MRNVAEFAFGDAVLHLLAAEFVFQNFLAVEPVFDFVAVHVNAGRVPFAGGVESGGFVRPRRDHFVKGGGAVFAVVLALGLGGIVEHLIFVADAFAFVGNK